MQKIWYIDNNNLFDFVCGSEGHVQFTYAINLHQSNLSTGPQNVGNKLGWKFLQIELTRDPNGEVSVDESNFYEGIL